LGVAQVAEAGALARRRAPRLARRPPARRGVRRSGAAARRDLGAEEMLRRLAPFTLAAALVATSAVAQAEGLRRPEKLTVALSDELLGQLSPDGKRLYFLSNRNATSQVFTHELDRPSATLLFDEGADVSWPRLSPDGKRLLYVSYRDDATGRLCVRELPKLQRTCLEKGGALAAAWLAPDRIL